MIGSCIGMAHLTLDLQVSLSFHKEMERNIYERLFYTYILTEQLCMEPVASRVLIHQVIRPRQVEHSEFQRNFCKVCEILVVYQQVSKFIPQPSVISYLRQIFVDDIV